MANDCLFFRHLLLALVDEFRPTESTKKKVNELVDRVRESLVKSGLRPLETDEIKSQFKDDGNRPVHMPAIRQFIILRGPDNERPMVPVLGLNVDMDGSALKWLRVSLALYVRDNDREEDGFSLKALGYRFEMPEGLGTHNFCHVQNVRQFNPASYLRLDAEPWIPDSQPSFPLRADTAPQLLVCTLVAIYGEDVLKRLSSSVKTIRDYF